MAYTPAPTAWLSACRLGVGVHWTAHTVPYRGEPKPFAEAVAAFDLPAFVGTLVECGADYLIFTTTHALQQLACPHPVVERLLPGRTCERDLLGELVEALEAAGIKAVFYYNHSCNHGDDPAWEQAVGYHDARKDRFAENLAEIVAWMGERYGRRLHAWWFDSSYSVDPSGPHCSVSTDLAGFQFPWERYTEAAKSGFADRLVTYNAGVNQTYLYTTHQDYWAGELVDLDHPPRGSRAANGLAWHGWTCLDDRAWVHSRRDTDPPAVLYSDEQVAAYLEVCRRHAVPMCFNVIIDQAGTLNPAAVRQLRAAKREAATG